MAIPGLSIIEETARLVKEGKSVTLNANGHSMYPFINGKTDDITLVAVKTAAIGDVVLAWVNDTHYVIHRIIAIQGECFTLMGDGNLNEQEHCLSKDIIARVDYVIKRKTGKRIYLYSKYHKRMAMIWFKLLPIRRYLLAIYRRI